MSISISGGRNLLMEMLSQRMRPFGWRCLSVVQHEAEQENVILMVSVVRATPPEIIHVPTGTSANDIFRIVTTSMKLKGCLSTSRQNA